MLKSILVFLIFIQFLKADFLYIVDNTCINNLQPNHNSTGWCFKKNDENYCIEEAKYTDFLNGYFLDENGNCSKLQVLNLTGLSYEDYQFQQALLANLFGFTLVFMLSFLYVLQGRR